MLSVVLHIVLMTTPVCCSSWWSGLWFEFLSGSEALGQRGQRIRHGRHQVEQHVHERAIQAVLLALALKRAARLGANKRLRPALGVRLTIDVQVLVENLALNVRATTLM